MKCFLFHPLKCFYHAQRSDNATNNSSNSSSNSNNNNAKLFGRRVAMCVPQCHIRTSPSSSPPQPPPLPPSTQPPPSHLLPPPTLPTTSMRIKTQAIQRHIWFDVFTHIRTGLNLSEGKRQRLTHSTQQTRHRHAAQHHPNGPLLLGKIVRFSHYDRTRYTIHMRFGFALCSTCSNLDPHLKPFSLPNFQNYTGLARRLLFDEKFQFHSTKL